MKMLRAAQMIMDSGAKVAALMMRRDLMRNTTTTMNLRGIRAISRSDQTLSCLDTREALTRSLMILYQGSGSGEFGAPQAWQRSWFLGSLVPQ